MDKTFDTDQRLGRTVVALVGLALPLLSGCLMAAPSYAADGARYAEPAILEQAQAVPPDNAAALTDEATDDDDAPALGEEDAPASGEDEDEALNPAYTPSN